MKVDIGHASGSPESVISVVNVSSNSASSVAAVTEFAVQATILPALKYRLTKIEITTKNVQIVKYHYLIYKSNMEKIGKWILNKTKGNIGNWISS